MLNKIKDAKKISFIVLIGMFLLMPIIIAQPDITVTNPEDKVYDSALIKFSLTSTEKSLFYYADMSDSNNWRLICPKMTTSCVRDIRVKSGLNNLEFKAVNGNGESSNIEPVKFIVRDKKPVILKTLPSERSYVNESSLFSVTYKADYLKSIKLFINGDEVEFSADCQASTLKKPINKCNSTIENLASYEGYAQYWFEIDDGANKVLSKKTSIKIDTIQPVLVNNNVINQDPKHPKSVKFILDVNEDNFDKITYRDEYTCKKQTIPTIISGVLCSQLKTGRCVVTKNFCEGTHDLIIIIKDKAGNSYEHPSESLDIDE